MSLIQAVNSIKDEAPNIVICPIVTRLRIRTMPAASLLVGEVTLSYLLHYDVILPSPIGIELMEFPAKMIYIIERKKIAACRLRAIRRLRFRVRPRIVNL